MKHKWDFPERGEGGQGGDYNPKFFHGMVRNVV